MRKIGELEGQEELAAWIKKNINDSVSYLMGQSLFDSVMVEAKPVWVYPFGVLIGMARGKELTGQTVWFINDGERKDHLSGGEVSTPREAARHFALKWQMDASRGEAIDTELVKKAEALYEFSENDLLWTG